MKSVDTLNKEILCKRLSLEELDEYMANAGFDSILPVDENLIENSGLIWYPFEPFLNQINIWVDKVDDNKYLIKCIEHFQDC